MIEQTRYGQTYHVSPRQQTPHHTDKDNKCRECGRKKSECGLSDCARHYHDVEVRS